MNRHTDSSTHITPSKWRVGVLGATGMTGTELIKQLQHHDACQIVYATSRGSAGKSLQDIDPSAPDITLQSPEACAPEDVDIAFICLPHGTTAQITERYLKHNVRVLDLSGDLRLTSERLHQTTYGTPRPEGLAKEAAYGLTEFNREQIKHSKLVSNPGCYPTCSMMGLAPLIQSKTVTGTIVINAVSGISGAGRSPKAGTHFCMAYNDVKPYKVGRHHRHVPEIEQTISRLAETQESPKVIFNPHTVPVERGMLATITVETSLSFQEVRALYEEAYGNEPFVRLLPEGRQAQLRAIQGTNHTVIGLHEVEGSQHIVITSAIDNLLKGAAGQAIQNMNVMLGLPETQGL